MAQVIGTEEGEVLNGSAGRDVVLGLGGDDELRAEAGDDLLDGGAGRDTMLAGEGDDLLVGGSFAPLTPGEDDDLLDGGPGSDWVLYLEQSVIVDLPGGTAESNNALDQLVAIENIAASGILIGDAGDNILVGLGRQFDFFTGGAGDDLILGSPAVHPGGFPNFDIVQYDQDPAGVVVNLSTGQAEDGFGDHDRIAGVEAVSGSLFDDIIIGNAAPNHLTGADGEDRIEGLENDDLLAGGPGVDDLDGGEGSDWVISNASETIDLEAGTATDPFSGEVDTLASLENVLSFGSGDVLFGTDEANRFVTSESNSTMTGRGGADSFLQLLPGTGLSIDTITDFEPGSDLVQFESDVFSFEAPLSMGPLDPAFFAIGAAADEDDFFIFEPGSGTLSLDRDGSGEAEAVPSLIVEGEVALSAADIEIIEADFLGSLVLGSEDLLA